MSDMSTPPECFICKKTSERSIENSYYCICDVAICHDCINSTKKNDTTWICPKCLFENNLEESRLFRSS